MKTAALHPLAKLFVSYCHRLHQDGHCRGRLGSLSARDEDIIWITPDQQSTRDIRPESLIQIWPNGRVTADPGLLPAETFELHQAVYQAYEDIQAVIHAYPSSVLALQMTNIPLDNSLVWASDHLPSLCHLTVPALNTEAAQKAVATHVSEKAILLLGPHGVWVAGKTLTDAYDRLELLVWWAQTSLTTHIARNTP